MDNEQLNKLTQLFERTASIEGKVDLFIKRNDCLDAQLAKLAERIAFNEAAAKSAHKRLDNFEQQRKDDRESLRWTIGIGVTISGIVCGLLTHFLGR